MPKQDYQDHLKPEFKELDTAIESGNLAKVKELINQQNINAEVDTKYKNTPLNIATVQGKPEIVKYLLEQKSHIDKKYFDKYTALTDAINFYANGNGESYRKIAVELIKQGSDITLPSVKDYLLKLKEDDHLRQLIEKLIQYRANKDPDVGVNIGFQFEKLGEVEEAFPWYFKAAQRENVHGMYNYALHLVKKKNIKEAVPILLKNYHSWKNSSDKLHVIQQLEKAIILRSEIKDSKASDINPQDLYSMSMLIANHYLQHNDKTAFAHLITAFKTSQQFAAVKPKPEEEKLLQAVNILNLNTIKFSRKNGEEKHSSLFNQDYLRAIELLAEAARLGSIHALNILTNNLKNEPIHCKIATCYFLGNLPSLPDSVKQDCEKIAAESKDFFNGLNALYGWGRKSNTAEAIKTFENIAATGKYAAIAYLHSAVGHCQIATKTNDEEERSERIAKAIKTFTLLKTHYQDYFSPEKQFSRTEVYNQLFQLLAITKNQNESLQLIKMILDFYKLESSNKAPRENRLIAVINTLSNNVFLKTNLEAWTLTIDTLLDCHSKIDILPRKDLFLTQLKEMEKLSENLNVKFQFFAKKALADCYNRYQDKESLHHAIHHYESAHKIAAQAEEKFNLENCRDTYKRFGATLQADDAIAAYSKAADLGDVESSLRAAAVAEMDENQIDKAISSYKKAMEDALKTQDMKNILATLKQIFIFKDKLDLSTKRNTQIEAIIYSAQEILNNKNLIQPYLKDFSEIAQLSQRVLPQDKIKLLFANYTSLDQETKNAENIAKLTSEKNVIKNLLMEFEKNCEEKNLQNCQRIKDALFKFISENNQLITSELIKPIFQHVSKNKSVIQLQQELIKHVETSLEAKETRDVIASNLLTNLYTTLVSLKEGELKPSYTERLAIFDKLIEVLKRVIFNIQGSENNRNHAKKNLELIAQNEKDPAIILKVVNALTITDYHLTKKNPLHLAQCNFLPAVFDLFEKYKTPTTLGKEHKRRPLYLAAKILLLTLDKKAAEKQFYLKKPQIEMMIKEASNKLREVAETNLKNVKESSEKYQYARLAQWYREVIESAKGNIIEDPDAFLLKASLVEQNLFDMNQIRNHLALGMKQALKVDDKWIIQKSSDVSMISNMTAEAKASVKNVASIKPLKPLQIKVAEPSAPLYEGEMESYEEESPPFVVSQEQNKVAASILPSKGLYPVLESAINLTEELDSKDSAKETKEPLSVYPSLESPLPQYESKLVPSKSIVAPVSYAAPEVEPVELDLEDEPGATQEVDKSVVQDKMQPALGLFSPKSTPEKKAEKITIGKQVVLC